MKAYRFARFAAIEDLLRLGWMVAIPNGVHHHMHYGIELSWLCDCRIPGEKN